MHQQKSFAGDPTQDVETAKLKALLSERDAEIATLHENARLRAMLDARDVEIASLQNRLQSNAPPGSLQNSSGVCLNGSSEATASFRNPLDDEDLDVTRRRQVLGPPMPGPFFPTPPAPLQSQGPAPEFVAPAPVAWSPTSAAVPAGPVQHAVSRPAPQPQPESSRHRPLEVRVERMLGGQMSVQPAGQPPPPARARSRSQPAHARGRSQSVERLRVGSGIAPPGAPFIQSGGIQGPQLPVQGPAMGPPQIPGAATPMRRGSARNRSMTPGQRQGGLVAPPPLLAPGMPPLGQVGYAGPPPGQPGIVIPIAPPLLEQPQIGPASAHWPLMGPPLAQIAAAARSNMLFSRSPVAMPPQQQQFQQPPPQQQQQQQQPSGSPQFATRRGR